MQDTNSSRINDDPTFNPSFNPNWNRSQVLLEGALIAFSAIAWYNAAEIIFLTLRIFKRYAGLYFWSMLITAISIIPYIFGSLSRDTNIITDDIATTTVALIGWMIMVTGQSLVLYSRLHLIHDNRRTMKFILTMIIVLAVLLYPPVIYVTYGDETDAPIPYTGGYWTVQKVQLCVFTALEFFISGVYLVDVYKMLNILSEGWKRTVLWELVAINVSIIILDIMLLVVQFEDLNSLEATLKGFVYSIKLKLEFEVLSKLVAVANSTGSNGSLTTIREQPENEFALAPDRPPQQRRPRKPVQNIDPNDKRQTMFPDMLERVRGATHQPENRKTVFNREPDLGMISPDPPSSSRPMTLPPLQLPVQSLMSQQSIDSIFGGIHQRRSIVSP